MALKFIFFHFITALVAVNLIFADEESDRFGLLNIGNLSGATFGLPFLGGDGNSSGGLSSLLNLPFFGFFGNGQQLASSLGSRHERSADNESDDAEPQERLFFGSIVSCNYTAQGGTACSSCRQSLACFANNVGRLRTCRGLLRYCNNGRCSFIPGELCTNSTA